jgi:hypothetical protein
MAGSFVIRTWLVLICSAFLVANGYYIPGTYPKEFDEGEEISGAVQGSLDSA